MTTVGELLVASPVGPWQAIGLHAEGGVARIGGISLRFVPPPGTAGVVGWGCSVEWQGPQTDNIEINSASHTGLGVNPLVWYAVGQRLAQAEDAWAHFSPKGMARLLFPFTAPAR